MKPDLIQPSTRPAIVGDLVMRPVLGIAADGCALLGGVAANIILDLAHAPPAPGLIAICRDTPTHVAILGYVEAAQARGVAGIDAAHDDDGWMVIGTGKAQIRLHPDGRVRIKAEDVTLDSSGRLGLRGAWIDLN